VRGVGSRNFSAFIQLIVSIVRPVDFVRKCLSKLKQPMLLTRTSPLMVAVSLVIVTIFFYLIAFIL